MTSYQVGLPILTSAAGVVLIGGSTVVVTKSYQNRLLDRQIRMAFVARTGGVCSAIHCDLSFYERWVRHGPRDPADETDRCAQVDQNFIEQRKKLSALQIEIDAYFGPDTKPGVFLHRLTDLATLRYAIILKLPSSQLTEIVDHVGRPGHSGYSVQELLTLLSIPRPTGTRMWKALDDLENSYMVAFHESLDAILATKRSKEAGRSFKSNKLLTAYDERRSVAPLGIEPEQRQQRE